MSFIGNLFGKKKTANGLFRDVLEGSFSNLATDQKCAIIALVIQ